MSLNYNPDVLDALANLSNDEVFTPPKIVNQILDLLPTEIWSDSSIRFLDPATKSGVFLREIVKRLNIWLEQEIPDLQTRLNHILTKQVFGIAITQLTGLLARRSVYCAKHANGKYSISTAFDTKEWNIISQKVEHSRYGWSCRYCGASETEYTRDESLENYAYQFIHTPLDQIPFLFSDDSSMKFDVIIGNPPYQLNTWWTQSQVVPIYHKFIEQAKKLNPRFLSMIIPSRWFAWGMWLDLFRSEMLWDGRISRIIDYTNAKDCFPWISLGGWVNYFLWDKTYDGLCDYTSTHNWVSRTKKRKLDDFAVFVRHNDALDIINKILLKNEKSLKEIVSSLSPFWLWSSERWENQHFDNSVVLYSSKWKWYINKNNIKSWSESINKYKVMVSKVTSEHAWEPNKEWKYKVFSKLQVLEPNEICTFSYFIIWRTESSFEVQNIFSYLKTKFVRFLLLQAVSSINLSKDKFIFVPLQNFSQSRSDTQLYKKYNLTEEEIAFIESMIRPME